MAEIVLDWSWFAFTLGFLAGFGYAALLAWAVLHSFMQGEWFSDEFETE